MGLDRGVKIAVCHDHVGIRKVANDDIVAHRRGSLDQLVGHSGALISGFLVCRLARRWARATRMRSSNLKRGFFRRR